MASSLPATAAPFRTTWWKSRLSVLQDVLLVVVCSFFFVAHARLVLHGDFAAAFFAVEQGLMVGMFLTRRRTDTTSTRVRDWIVATLGAWLTLAVRPGGTDGPIADIGIWLQLIGLTSTIVCFASLGKSFGVVAANRGLKVQGPYSLVRHPIYASHLITLSGLLVANASLYNFAIAAVAVSCQLMRIQAEERVLSATSDYDTYRTRVPWRIVPGVF